MRTISIVLPAAILVAACAGEVRTHDGGTGDADALDGDRDGAGADAGDGPAGDTGFDGADGTDVGADAPGDADASDGGTAIGPWVVFSLADENVPMSGNLLQNAALESESGGAFDGWRVFQAGYQAGLGEGRTGNALRLSRGAADSAQYGAYQSIRLDRHETKPLFFSGWSKAEALTGSPDGAASIYLDIQYMTVSDDPERGCDPATAAPCALYGQIPAPPFDTGSHDWQHRTGFAVPAYPIKSVSFYVLLRGDHTGTVWFDDLALSEVEAEVLPFDGRIVATRAPAAAYRDGAPLAAATGDGLSLSLWSGGGAPAALRLDGQERLDPARDYLGGLFFHEMSGPEWIAPGGSVAAEGGALVQRAALAEHGLDLLARITPSLNRLDVHVEIESRRAEDRPITLYFALPVLAPGGVWGDDARRARPLAGARELTNTASFWYTRLGATGAFSVYPLATLANGDFALVLGVPLDQSRIFRLAYNPSSHQLYLACDVGLSPATTKFPNRAWLDFTLFRTRPPDLQSAFRAALQGFYERFPSHFARRIPPAQEGIWVAFADLSQVQNEPGQGIEDFGIGIHEIGSLAQVAFDDAHGILALRYISEPASTWLRITDGSVDVENYPQVLDYLQGLYASGTASQRALAEKTLSSGIFDVAQRYVYEPYREGPPWCPGACALFTLSSDPDISEPPYALNQARYAWNAQAAAAYQTYPGLDGEYLDSFVMWATVPDFRRSHFSAVDAPLTFIAEPPHPLGVPIVFSTIEFARWLKPQLPGGKYLIANAMLIRTPWGADLMDFMGQEVDWVRDTGAGFTLVPESDEALLYRRSLSYQRPYGFLMNTDFSNMSYEMVERYMRTCLFYGIYPSMFSHNASEDNYFATPALYQRDRPLFVRYVPLIRAINAAGWEPLPFAASGDAAVYLERFGGGGRPLYFTLRNTSDSDRSVRVTLDRARLGLDGPLTVRSLIAGAPDQPLGAGDSSFLVSLPAGDVELVQLLP